MSQMSNWEVSHLGQLVKCPKQLVQCCNQLENGWNFSQLILAFKKGRILNNFVEGCHCKVRNWQKAPGELWGFRRAGWSGQYLHKVCSPKNIIKYAHLRETFDFRFVIIFDMSRCSHCYGAGRKGLWTAAAASDGGNSSSSASTSVSPEQIIL